MEKFRHNLEQLIGQSLLPRILTQACRDPFSHAHGCFDRDWWHYKIRDFPSIILQQAGYTLWLAGKAGFSSASQNSGLIQASGAFWAKRVLRHGALEEYYPWEDGYPPLAFSTLAIAKLCLGGVFPADKFSESFARMSRKLIGRFEPLALNQQVAGLAALAAVRRIRPSWVPSSAFDKIARQTLAQQTSEGWFPEYGGPDLGYLSVTLDCLWDLFELTGEERFLESAARAFRFIEEMTLPPFHGLGMLQARNTDYLVPYGLCRFISLSSSWSQRVESLIHRIYLCKAPYAVSFQQIDDRYLCHYIGHSLVRAFSVLADSASKNHGSDSKVAVGYPPEAMPTERAGIVRLSGSPAVLCCFAKGGTFASSWGPETWAADYGWVVRRGKRLWVSHVWSKEWKWQPLADGWEISGYLFPYREALASPWNHLLLRLIALVSGRHLIRWLKSRLIFQQPDRNFPYRRRVRRIGPTIEVEDWIGEALASDRIDPAPRSSSRHVASADTWHREDAGLIQNVNRQSEAHQSKDGRRIHTRYVMGTAA